MHYNTKCSVNEQLLTEFQPEYWETAFKIKAV